MLGPVSISIPTILVEAAIFLLMVAAMEWLVFEPIRRVWAERDREIQEGLAASSQSREEAQRAREEVRRLLAEARRTAQSQIDRASVEGGKVRDELVAQATDEFRRLVEQARAEIDAERRRAETALLDRIVDIALQAAAKVTGKSFDEPQVRELAASVVRREGLG